MWVRRLRPIRRQGSSEYSLQLWVLLLDVEFQFLLSTKLHPLTHHQSNAPLLWAHRLGTLLPMDQSAHALLPEVCLCNAQLSISDTTVNQPAYCHATMSERRATTVGTSSEGSFVAGQQLSPAAVPRSSDLTGRHSTHDQPQPHHSTQGQRATTVGMLSTRRLYDGQQRLAAASPNSSSGGLGAIMSQTQVHLSMEKERRATAVCASTIGTRSLGRTPLPAAVSKMSSGVLGAVMPV